MAATAVLATAIVGATAASMETAAQGRRLAGQAKNRQEDAVRVADNQRREAERQEENRTFSKIQRQRQRAAMGAGIKPGGDSIMSGGANALGAAATGSGGIKPGAVAGAMGAVGSSGGGGKMVGSALSAMGATSSKLTLGS